MIIRLKKIPIEKTCAEFWNVVFIPDPAPRCSGGRLFITAGPVRRPERGHDQPGEEQQESEQPVGEVDRQQLKQDERNRRPDHPAGRERPRPEPVRENPRQRPRDQEPGRERQHGQPRPQRRPREVVAVQWQPDPLQPDDQHEHQPAAAQRGEEAGQHSGRERADLEQLDAEHRLGNPVSIIAERDQQRHPDHQEREHLGVRPAHGVGPYGSIP